MDTARKYRHALVHDRVQGRVARTGKSWPTRLSVLACLLLLPAFAAAARAQILADCDTEDDFCTGDPCVTPDKIEVTVPSCVLDFGSRALVIAETVTVPNNGTLSLTAGSIEVQRRIKGRHTTLAAGDGAHISLIASGDITIRKPIDVSAKVTNGSIVLDAGGNVELRRVLRARGMGKGATATGGTITVSADGTVSSTLKGKIDARGRPSKTVGGQVSIEAAGGADIGGRVDVRGSTAGSISVTSSGGDVTLDQKILAKGTPDMGGSVTVEAQGDINTTDKAPVQADGKLGNLGMITFSAAGTVTVDTLTARGRALGDGGSISIFAGTVNAKTLSVRGKGFGGTITVTTQVGDLFLRKADAKSAQNTGGSIFLTSAANLSLDGSANVAGDLAGGEMRFASSGDMLLDGGHFDATGTTGGTIEGLAGGDLIADGSFKAEVGGCIGLAAGGTLNTGGASFDVTLSGSCP